MGHIKNKIHQFASKLCNINKSITGEGIGKTLSKVKGHLPILEIKLIPAIQCKKFTYIDPLLIILVTYKGISNAKY